MKWWSRLKLDGVYNMHPNDYRVMDVLAYQHHMKDERRSLFTKSRLAGFCDMGRKSLRRSIANLEKNGWIELDKHHKGYAILYSIPIFDADLKRNDMVTDVAF